MSNKISKNQLFHLDMITYYYRFYFHFLSFYLGSKIMFKKAIVTNELNEEGKNKNWTIDLEPEIKMTLDTDFLPLKLDISCHFAFYVVFES